MLEHKEAIISFKLGFIIFWGFHTLGYIHNDTVVAFGQPEKQILFEPLFEYSSSFEKQFMNLMFIIRFN
jgi:photosystem I P700 chlorophyll a apoprotein A2